MPLDTSKHPCFNREARHTFSRVHLPVAPNCNVQCNFCDRRFDCLNESRPGVTSSLLSPHQALHYLKKVNQLIDRVSVVGIAGPGDPFANPIETMRTFHLVREYDPEMLLCVASNGLGIGPYLDELAELQVSHVTITVNAVDPDISGKVYAWVRDGRQVFRGREAAELLLERQLAAIRGLAERDILVKVNTIVMPGLNDHHIPEVCRTVAEAGAKMLNCMPLHPVEGTALAHLGNPSGQLMKQIRESAGTHLPQMMHCARCRADAVGKIGEEAHSDVVACLQQTASGPLKPDQARPYFAVATLEGLLVNQHLGEAESLAIYEPGDENGEFALVEERETPPEGGGTQRWEALADLLGDCWAVLVSGVGNKPKQVLIEEGVKVILTEGLVEDALQAAFSGQTPSPPRKIYRCGEVCSGSGQGCS